MAATAAPSAWRRFVMRHPVLIIGAVLLLFSLAGYWGNFVQWSGADRTTATILGGRQVWARHGRGNFDLKIAYKVRGAAYTGEVSVSPSTLEKAVKGDGDLLEVFCMKGNPRRVVPAAVLHGKQRMIVVTFVLGVVVTVVGTVLAFRKRDEEPEQVLAATESASPPRSTGRPPGRPAARRRRRAQ